MSVVLDKCACTPLSSGNQLETSFTLLCRSSFFKERQLYNCLFCAFPSKDTVKFLANRMIRSFLCVQINSAEENSNLYILKGASNRFCHQIRSAVSPAALWLHFVCMSLIRKVTQKIKWPEQWKQRALPARLWLRCTHLLCVKHW